MSVEILQITIVLCRDFTKYGSYLAKNCHRNAACDRLPLGTLEDDGGAGQGRIHPERPGRGAACPQRADQRRKGGAGKGEGEADDRLMTQSEAQTRTLTCPRHRLMSPGGPSERPAGGAEVGDAALRGRAQEAGDRVGPLPHHGEAEAGESRPRGGQPLGEERGLYRQSSSGRLQRRTHFGFLNK